MNIVPVHNRCMNHWTPEEIKIFRKRLGLYQKDFAPTIGVTERYVIYLEKGVRQPSKTLQILLPMMEKQEIKNRKEKKKNG
jgi:DNA-binding transcriptional regulator YiaG